MIISLENSTALVTGSSKGIGLAIATKLLEANADLILNSRHSDDLALVRNILEARFPERKIGISAYDFSDASGIPEWYDQICDKHGPINILINNAGTIHREAASDIKLEDFRKVLTTNLDAVFILCQQFYHHLSSKPGKIINISSLISNLARETNVAYASSKGAINQLTRTLALEWAKKGINVNAIAPGFIHTDLTDELFNDENFNNWVKEKCPMSRWGEPEDISSTAVFLASSVADYITGQIIYVDGGWTASL